MSIRTAIILWTLLIALTPMAIITAQGLHCARQAVMDLQAQNLRDMLAMHRERAAAWLHAASGGPREPAELPADILLHPTSADDPYKVFLLDRQGRVAAVPPALAAQRGLAAALPAALADGLGAGVFSYPDWRGRDVLGTAAALPELGAVMVVELDQQRAFAWVGTLGRRALWTALLVLVLVVLVALHMAGRLSQPLRQLARAAALIEGGQHDLRLGRFEVREADDLAAAFNRMLDVLKAAEARLVQQAALAAVGEFSASLVHEMRSPLASIRLNLEALNGAVAGRQPLAELGEIATRQLDRLERLATDLLNYGKPLVLDPRPLAVAPLLDETIAAFATRARQQNVRLTVACPTGLPPVRADAEQLKGVLANLLDNALHATPAGGTVTLAAAPAATLAGGVTLTVSDTGPGIPEPVRARLFHPFVTGRPDGTGLGLANVRKVVELLGGTVRGENLPAGGARFTLELPGAAT